MIERRYNFGWYCVWVIVEVGFSSFDAFDRAIMRWQKEYPDSDFRGSMCLR